jgi:hypothetical protein
MLHPTIFDDLGPTSSNNLGPKMGENFKEA